MGTELGREDMKTIYVIFSCNIWKERSSMRMVAGTTSRHRLKAILMEKIETGDMEYEGDSMKRQ